MNSTYPDSTAHTHVLDNRHKTMTARAQHTLTHTRIILCPTVRYNCTAQFAYLRPMHGPIISALATSVVPHTHRHRAFRNYERTCVCLCMNGVRIHARISVRPLGDDWPFQLHGVRASKVKESAQNTYTIEPQQCLIVCCAAFDRMRMIAPAHAPTHAYYLMPAHMKTPAVQRGRLTSFCTQRNAPIVNYMLLKIVVLRARIECGSIRKTHHDRERSREQRQIWRFAQRCWLYCVHKYKHTFCFGIDVQFEIMHPRVIY